MAGDIQTVGDVLRSALAEENISVRELARRLAGDRDDAAQIEKERRALYKVLTGGQQPGPAQAGRIAAALGRSPDWLVREGRRRINRVAELQAEVERLRAEVARLQEQRSPEGAP